MKTLINFSPLYREGLTPGVYPVYSYVDEKGKVTRITAGTVEVTLECSEACTKCPARDFCLPSGSKRVIGAVNPGGIEIGDEVTVTMIRRHSLIAVFSFFGLPVFLSLIGLLIGQPYSEICSLIMGTSGFIIGLGIAKIINDILGRKRSFSPTITLISKKT